MKHTYLYPLKVIAVGCALLNTAFSFGQVNYNRWSIDLNGGLNKSIHPFATGYDSDLIHFGHVDGGFRFMTNNNFGVKWDVAYDGTKNDKDNSNEFRTKYMRTDLQGVVNLHNVFNFSDWTKRLGLQLHAGMGYSTMGNDSIALFSEGHSMVNFMIGVSPMVKINERFAIVADASFISHIYQDYTWDLSRVHYDQGFDGLMSTATIGVSIYLGKKERHADWVPNGIDMSVMDSLSQRINDLEASHKDDDSDGVPNYLDQEPGTAAGAKVDHAGKTILPADQRDTDGDGVNDAEDLCPEVAGKAKGCPDRDGDGVPDVLDGCPDEKGTAAANGCVQSSMSGGSGLEQYGIIDVLFELEQDAIRPDFTKSLDNAVKYMKSNPSAKLQLTGYADDRGTKEYNDDLSRRRAENAKSYMVQKGIAADRLTVVAKGESEPKYSGSSLEGYAANRRVAFSLR